MPTAIFLDTSILLEILRVPGKSQQPERVTSELRDRIERGQSLFLPTAAIIETGNHIAQLDDGGERRRRAVALATLLRGTANEQAPWKLNTARWDSAFLHSMADGPGGCPKLEDMAIQRIGAGDVSVLAEVADYRRRVAHVEVEVWTLDTGLAAYA